MKKFYILTILFALLGMNLAWANTATKEEGTWDSNRSWTGAHANFEIAGTNSKDGKHLDIAANADQTISWTVDEGYTINVTELKMKVGHNGWLVNNCDIYLNNEKKETIGTTTDSKLTYSGYSLGNNGKFILKTSRQVDLYWITITYTITPNDKPAQTSTEETINVTVNNADKQTIDLTKIFTVTAVHAAESQVFEFTENPGNKGAIENGLFYATAAGTYKVKSRIAAKADCHEATAWTDELTITVNHLDDALAWENETAIRTNMVLGTEQTIAALATSGRKPTYESDNSEVLAVDANGVLTAKALGTATITASLDGDTQYNKPESITKKFTVREKETPHFQPVGFTEENSVLELHQQASIILNNIDADFAYEVTEGAVISVTRDADTLRIEALSLGEATITLTQPGSLVLNELEKVFTISVTKITPTFKVLVNGVEQTSIDLNPTQTATIAASSTDSDGEVTIDLFSGESVKYAAGVIEALSKTGASVIRAAIAETEEYKGFSADITVNVAFAAEEADYVLEELPDHGINGTDSRSYDLSGAGDILTIEVWKVTAATGGLALYGYDASNNETKIIEYSNAALTTDPVLKTIKISPDFVKIKVQSTTGTLNKKFQNLRVTRKVYLNVSAAEIATHPLEEGKGSLTIGYSLGVCGDLKIACDNEAFAFDKYVVAGVEKKSGTANVGITLTPQTEEGTHTANVIIYNRVYSRTLQLTATVEKYAQTITWAKDALLCGDTLENAAASDLAEAEINYVSDNEDVIRVVDNKLIAVGAGTATVTATTEATTTHRAGYSEQVFSVSKVTPTIEIEEEKKDEIVLTEGQELNVITIDDFLKALNNFFQEIKGLFTWKTPKTTPIIEGSEDEEQEFVVVFTPEDSTTYEATEVVVPVKVRKATKKILSIEWDAEYTSLKVSESGYYKATATVSALDDEDIYITSSDSAIAYVEEFTGWIILPGKTGVVTLTAHHDGDNEYQAAQTQMTITVSSDTATGVEDADGRSKAQKFIQNGVIYIRRGDKLFTIDGRLAE